MLQYKVSYDIRAVPIHCYLAHPLLVLSAKERWAEKGDQISRFRDPISPLLNGFHDC